MLELARLTLNDRGRRAVRDAHAMHVLLMRALPDAIGGRAGAGLLYRIEDEGSVLAQSAIPARWDAIADHLHTVVSKDIEEAHSAIGPGSTLKFLLHANPTFDAVIDGRRRRTGIREPARQIEWLARKLGSCGARLATDGQMPLVALGESWEQKTHRRGERLTHRGVAYRGALVVDDPDAFRTALRAGVGRGRAYGFGLLSVAP